MAALAGPIVFMQLGMVALGVEDTLFMGMLGAEYIAAVGLGHALIFCLMIFGVGTLYGIDALSSQAVGAKDIPRSVQVFYHALIVAFGVALICWSAITFLTGPILRYMEIKPEVVSLLHEYVDVVRWIYFPGLMFMATRQYLQSLSVVRKLMIVLVIANIINILVNYTLVFGNYGFPRLEVKGVAYATLAANLILLGGAQWILWLRLLKEKSAILRPRFDGKLLAHLVQLGVPGGIQSFFEASIFSFVSLIVSKFGALPLAAHQLTLNLASVTFMVPMGISYAAAVRVGYGIGARDYAVSKASGMAALFMSFVFMTLTCLTFILIPRHLLGFYTDDESVILIGIGLLFVAGIFQIADGLQVTLTGMIRGLGNTKASMIANLISHWGIGFPLGYYLGFHAGMGATGLWVGLSVGLGLVAISLYIFWLLSFRKLLRSA